MTAVASAARLEQNDAAAIRLELREGRASTVELVRAFGVVVRPSAALSAAAGVGLAFTVRSLVRGRLPGRSAAIVATATALYGVLGRRRMLNWGATAVEARKPLPGDEIVPDPGARSTRAVTIDAPVEDVWPWLAQIGQDRAGFYSYEWLENLAGCHMRNADELHPEWQRRDVAEIVYLHPRHGQPVALFEPNRVVALKGWGAFVLEPLPDGRTRLITRGRTPSGLAAVLGVALIEIPHFVMERKMLLGIKERAERRASSR